MRYIRGKEEPLEPKKKRLKKTATRKTAIPSRTASSHLRLERIQGDGNCLFRAVSRHVYGDETW